MSHNETEGISHDKCRTSSTNDDESEEELTHEYMETYLERAQKDIQRLIDRSTSDTCSSGNTGSKQQLNKINELTANSIGSYNDDDNSSETCGESISRVTVSDSRYSPSVSHDSISESQPSHLQNQLNDPTDTSFGFTKLNKQHQHQVYREQSRFATSSPTFDDNGNIIRSTRRTSFNKLATGNKLLSDSKEELYYDLMIKSNSPIDSLNSSFQTKLTTNKRQFNRIQSPVGSSASSNVTNKFSSKLEEGENSLSRRLHSSPIEFNQALTQSKHITQNKKTSQLNDTAVDRRASLGTNSVKNQSTSCRTDSSKESPSCLQSQDFDKLRLSGSDLHIPRSTIVSSHRAGSKTSHSTTARTSIGQFTNFISRSNQSSSSCAIGRANITSASNKSSPLRSVSPASSVSGLFNLKRAFLSFDGGHKIDTRSSTNLNDKISTSPIEQTTKKYSAIKARRSIASPLAFSTSIGGIFSGKHFHQQSSLTSVSSSSASLSVDSIPNTVAKQRDMVPGQSSSAITALVTAAVSNRNSFYENVDYDSLDSPNMRNDILTECDIRGIKPECVTHGRSMSVSNDDAIPKWATQNERSKLQQSCTTNRLQLSNKGRLVPLFGCDINSIELLTKVGLTLPPVIDSAMQHIIANGINSVGIFRKSGVKSRIMNLRQRIESNQGLKFETIEQTEFSIYDVADLIKMWFRELKPSPILTKELIKLISSNIALIKSQKQINTSVSDASTCNTSSSSLLSSLPASSTCKEAFNIRNHYSDLSQRINSLISSTHRAILIRVLKFFSRISSKCELNQMTAQNLAICLTPSLCYTEADQQSILMAQKALEYCINNYESLFMIKPAIYSNQRSNSLIDSSLTTRNAKTLLEMPVTLPKMN